MVASILASSWNCCKHLKQLCKSHLAEDSYNHIFGKSKKKQNLHNQKFYFIVQDLEHYLN
jgi:hypothetical protein